MDGQYPQLISILEEETIYGSILDQFLALPARTWTQNNSALNTYHISLRYVHAPRPFSVICIIQPYTRKDWFFCVSIPTEHEIHEGLQFSIPDKEYALRMVSVVMRYFIENTLNGNIDGRPGAWYTDDEVVSHWITSFFLSTGTMKPELLVMPVGNSNINRVATEAWTAFTNCGWYWSRFRDPLFV